MDDFNVQVREESKPNEGGFVLYSLCVGEHCAATTLLRNVTPSGAFKVLIAQVVQEEMRLNA